MEKLRFGPFIDELLENPFDWFITLAYWSPYTFKDERERDRLKRWEVFTDDGRAERARREREFFRCYRHWLDGLKSHPLVRHLEYVQFFEREVNGGFRMHFLVRNVGFLDIEWWLLHWAEIAKGRGYSREVNERLGGLLAHFVFKAGCYLEVRCFHRAGETFEFCGDYSAENFQSWRSRSD